MNIVGLTFDEEPKKVDVKETKKDETKKSEKPAKENKDDLFLEK